MLKVDFNDTTLLLLAIIGAIFLLITKKYPEIKKPVVVIVSITYLFCILLLTLQPIFICAPKIVRDEIRMNGLPWNIKPLSLIVPQWKNLLAGQRGAFRQFMGNIIMFIPVGVLMPFIFKKARSFICVLVFSFLFTLCIESLQFILHVFGMSLREFDVDDLILNTYGAMIGYIFYLVLIHKKKRKPVLEYN
jgi:glycopeptide antibiotics resistance protein